MLRNTTGDRGSVFTSNFGQVYAFTYAHGEDCLLLSGWEEKLDSRILPALLC